MKSLLLFLLTLTVAADSVTNITQINVGTTANDGTGWPVRQSFKAVNTNLTVLSNLISSISSSGAAIAGTVVNTGTPASGEIPKYLDTTGTNIGPSGVTITSGSGVNGISFPDTDGTTNYFSLTAHPSMSEDVELVGFSSLPPDGSAVGILISGGKAYLTNMTAGGGSGSSAFFNDVELSNPNFADSSYATWQVSSTNVSLSIQNIADLQIASGAAINAAKIADGSVSSAEFQRLDGVTSAIQTQIDSKVASTRAINTTAPITGGGDLSADRTIAIPAATSSANGYLSSADWSTFNGKQATISAGAGIGLSGATVSWAPETRVNNVTLWDGSQASRTITYDLSGTDSVWTISSGTVNLSTGALQVGGVAVSTATGANPSASVGLSSVNGSATSFMRSDGAPALSQAIAPTWTGAHTFNPSSGVPVTIQPGAADTAELTVKGGSVTGSGTTALIDLSGTWNTSGAAKFKRNIVTNTASGANALLETWETDAGVKLGVYKDGALAMPDTSIIYGDTTRNSQILRVGAAQTGIRDSLGIGNGTSGPSSPTYGLTREANGQGRISDGSTGSGTLKFSLRVTPAAAATIASAATIAPTAAITFISGTTTVDTITAPSPISSTGGYIMLIPTGIFLTSTSGNIALASTAVVNKALIMTYDATTTKWYPSY